VADNRLHRRVAHLTRVGVDDNLQCRAGQPAELGVDDVAGGDRLRSGRFPARAGERVLRLRREHAEPKRNDHPGEQDSAEVAGGEKTEPPERPVRRFVATGIDRCRWRASNGWLCGHR